MIEDLPQGFFLAATVFLGLVLGSFATALAYRLPRGLSIVKMKRSACPSCKRSLTFPDLVPVFSWLFLGGKCRTCKAGIGWQYPAIEIATLLLALAFYLRFHVAPETLFLIALAPLIVAIIAIDFDFMIIPDGLNIAIFLLGAAALAAAALYRGDPLYIVSQGGESLLAAILYPAMALLLRWIVWLWRKKDALGWGDVKLLAAAGFWLGLNPDSASYFMLAAGFSGILLALLWRKFKKEAEFPFGPCLMLAFVTLLLWQGPGFALP